ncbi:MAG: DNA polymerase III subunit delta, partial [Micromonosporaceae bacterium]|nr:DNA polymerase III subunit delta [Micromonosporaceae bacterium]
MYLVSGDDEFLVGRAVAGVVRAASATDPDSSITELHAGDLLPDQFSEALSPSLFGGRRVVVVRGGQDAKKDLIAAMLAYAADPDPDACLVVAHTGGAKGKALADGLREAGATVLPAARLTRHRERVDFVRDEIRRLGGKCDQDAAEALLAAVGSELRELAAACAQLIA